jgi:uncharacterized protein (TIGR02217 family)
MAFFEHRLEDCYSFGARGGPMFSTEVVKTFGGQRYANGNWAYPLHLYDISAGVKTEADFADLRAFFFNVGGRRDAFRFKDWADYRATRQPLSVITAGSVYQLLRRYTSGPRTFDRPIYKPVAGLTVYRNGSAIAPAVATTTGRVTVTGHSSGDVYTWTGEFDVPVAFVNDQLEHEIVNKGRDGLLISWPSIQLEETRTIA